MEEPSRDSLGKLSESVGLIQSGIFMPYTFYSSETTVSQRLLLAHNATPPYQTARADDEMP